MIAAATALFFAVLAAALHFSWQSGKAVEAFPIRPTLPFLQRENGYLTLKNAKSGELIARYPMRVGDGFGIGFIHSVNKSPVTDYYEIREDGIYVVRTVYYGFGAGVQTLIEGNEKLEYGDDGSMIVSGFDRRMDDLIYFVGTVSDHTLTFDDGEKISLRDLCGRNAMVRFDFEKDDSSSASQSCLKRAQAAGTIKILAGLLWACLKGVF